MYIQKIKLNDLEENIQYLKKKLNKNDIFAESLKNLIINSNKNIDFYGYCIYEK